MIPHEHRRVVLVSAAELEIADATLWYDEHRPGLGERFLAAVRGAALAAAESPAMYARVHGELRRVLVHRFPYALIVQERPGELVVLACFHLRRDPQVWQSRG